MSRQSIVSHQIPGNVTSEEETRQSAFPQKKGSLVVPKYEWYSGAKGVVDFIVAIVLLMFTAPVILIAALLVKFTSRGPAFYCQTRLGKDGKPFTLIKIRTMTHNAEAQTGPIWASEDDSRITKLGRFLRDTHLDEFPQLVNVLCGDMSLIGPRPERPEFVSKLEWELPNYRNRLRIRPGITGLAQMNLPPDTDLESVRCKLAHDIYYIRHMNPWLDLRIILFTVCDFLKALYRSILKPVSLPNRESIENLWSEIGEIDGCQASVSQQGRLNR